MVVNHFLAPYLYEKKNVRYIQYTRIDFDISFGA